MMHDNIIYVQVNEEKIQENTKTKQRTLRKRKVLPSFLLSPYFLMLTYVTCIHLQDDEGKPEDSEEEMLADKKSKAKVYTIFLPLSPYVLMMTCTGK
jgi:hypothetical protein